MYSLNCRGHLLEWKEPIIMGVLNITPDSFYSGSRIQSEDMLLRTAEDMLREGAAILDLGGLSSRPGAGQITIQEEQQRVVPAIRKIAARFPGVVISVDSYRYEVTKAALDAGASIINDIGAGSKKDMMKLAADLRVPYILMHMRGDPSTMQSMANYEDITREVLDFFIEQIAFGRSLGLNDIIIDPGFGFAKTPAQNFSLLKKMKLFEMLDRPVMVGLSRKSTIYKTLGIKPEESLNGTTVMHTLALERGASILRAHDVKEALEVIRLWTSYARA